MFQVDPVSRVPIYEQLINNVIRLTAAGVLKPGDRLPPVRTLASEAGVNPNTVAKAYRDLEARGFICSVVGKGSFIHPELTANATLKREAAQTFRAACLSARNSGLTGTELKTIVDDICKGG